MSLAWALIDAFGPIGSGIAFFGSYVFHGLMLYSIVRRLSGFRGLPANHRTGLLFVLWIAAVFSPRSTCCRRDGDSLWASWPRY